MTSESRRSNYVVRCGLCLASFIVLPPFPPRNAHNHRTCLPNRLDSDNEVNTTATKMSDSESSALSSPPSTDDEMPEPTPAPKSSVKSISKNNASILSFVESSPARKKRPASPPHEEVLADNPDIAVSRYRVNRVLLDVNYTSTRPASRCACS